MAAKFMMKNPILMLGILFMIIFLMQLNKKGYFAEHNAKLKATSCNAVLVMLNKRIPHNWITRCNKNNLMVTTDESSLLLKTKKINQLRPIFYREMANNLIFIAKNSPNDSLSRVFMVTLKMKSTKLDISAVTEGRFLARLSTLKNPKFIAQHLQSTVQTKESIK